MKPVPEIFEPLALLLLYVGKNQTPGKVVHVPVQEPECRQAVDYLVDHEFMRVRFSAQGEHHASVSVQLTDKGMRAYQAVEEAYQRMMWSILPVLRE